MKKFLTVLVLGVISVSLYGEVTIGLSADMAIVPFQLIINEENNDVRTIGSPEQEDIIFGAGLGRYGSGQGARARLDLRASYEDVIGFRMRLQARTDNVSIEDYLQAWWKPVPQLRLDAGRFFDDRLRGKVNDLDERMNDYTVRMYDGDAIFTRFRTHRGGGQAGLMASYTPTDNLLLGVLLYDLMPLTPSSSSLTASAVYDAHPAYVADNADAFHRIQAAAGYTIPDIGSFRVQYLGVKPRVDINRVSDEIIDDNNHLLFSYMFDTFTIHAPRFEAAVAYTGTPGLLIDLGVKVHLQFKNWDLGPDNIFEIPDEETFDPVYRAYKSGFVWQAPYQVSFGFRFTPSALPNLELAGRADTRFAGYMKGHADEVHFAPEVNFHIWPSYNFPFARIIFNLGFEYIGETKNKNGELIGFGSPVALNGGTRLGMGLSLQKTIANSLIKGGIAYKFAGEVNGIRENAVLSIPLFLEFSF